MISKVIMIMGLMTQTTLARPSDQDSINLQAFDCSKPQQVNNFALDQHTCGNTTIGNIEPEEKFSLIQKQEYFYATGHACRKKISRFTYVCTNNLVAAHQRLAGVPEIEIPAPVTKNECHAMITNGEFLGPDGVKHKVKKGAMNIFTFFEAGRQEISGSTIVCEGEKVKLGDRIVDGVAILEQMRVEVKDIQIRFKETGIVEIKEDHLLLPDTCQVYDHYCLLDDRSYIWGAPEPTKYQKILTLDGYIMKQEGQEVLISHSQKV